MSAIAYSGFTVGDGGQFRGASNAGKAGQVLTLSDPATKKTGWGGAAVVGDPSLTATGTRQFEVEKGGTGGSIGFYVTNRDGAGLDVGIDRYLNIFRDGFANTQVGVGAGGVSTLRAAETNIPIMLQGRGLNNSFGGCVLILNRTAPTDPALTPIIRLGIGLAYNSVTPDVDVFHGLHVLFHTGIKAPNLPTTDPAVAGAFWNNAGVVNVSAG